LLQQHYFSVSNSLMYSIYKMLPNDTDLTVWEQRLGFCIYRRPLHYLPAQDDINHLGKNTLATKEPIYAFVEILLNADLNTTNPMRLCLLLYPLSVILLAGFYWLS
jgi:hypothetical protein